MTQTIGFIGLGLMGQGFTARLKETGHRVVGFDIDAAKVAQRQSQRRRAGGVGGRGREASRRRAGVRRQHGRG